ncbi:MAG: hypothetical protein CTY10_07000 [Methylotenera sp.]|nr:MAG: hypothetical protein CTY10_07000 [Methylotenera sp.]
MVFKEETIPDSAFSDVLVNFQHHRLPSSQWVVDHERNIYMVLINKYGGPYEGTQETHYYRIFWNNIEISIEADPLKETFSSEGLELNWRIRKVNIPDVLELQGDDLVHIIFDSFVAKGRSLDGLYNYKVNIECSSPVELVRSSPLTIDEIETRAEINRLQDEIKVSIAKLEVTVKQRQARHNRPWWRKLLCL